VVYVTVPVLSQKVKKKWNESIMAYGDYDKIIFKRAEEGKEKEH
jgi:hypothetical protein